MLDLTKYGTSGCLDLTLPTDQPVTPTKEEKNASESAGTTNKESDKPAQG